MPGQPFLLTVAGLSLSVAGFAGLMAAFRRDATWTPTDLWRLRGIVRLSFLCMFLALFPVPLFALVQDETLAVATSSLIVASVYAWEALGVLRERAASGPATWMTAYLVMDAVLGGVQLANVVLVLPGLLMLGLLIRLAHPVGLFVEAIRSYQPAASP
jgi:hypothetical protein